jgi:hypothetical protein
MQIRFGIRKAQSRLKLSTKSAILVKWLPRYFKMAAFKQIVSIDVAASASDRLIQHFV